MRVLRFLGWYCVLTGVLALGMLVVAFPSHPKSLVGWVAFFLLALPVTIVGEVIGEGIWWNRLSRRIEEMTAGQSFSWWRITYAFVAMLLVFAVAWGLAISFGIDD